MTTAKQAKLAALCLLLVPGVAACESSSAQSEAHPPAVVEEVPGSDVKTVQLTDDAAAAAGIATAPVSAARVASELTMPYAAVIYYLDGTTWTYRLESKNTFRRVPIKVKSISGQVATLTAGPPVGSQVVVVGAPEVLGAELEISGEQ
ncbi:hypothetical protein GCM10009740_07890 [Terrabacter terrae]|uniref:Uncharacterized protein n=1 Tax=Terrabacter terrae TaxID=318434 RepID=A0ABP5FAS6_9MICO